MCERRVLQLARRPPLVPEQLAGSILDVLEAATSWVTRNLSSFADRSRQVGGSCSAHDSRAAGQVREVIEAAASWVTRNLSSFDRPLPALPLVPEQLAGSILDVLEAATSRVTRNLSSFADRRRPGGRELFSA